MSGGGLSLAFTGPARKARRLEVHETIEAVVREEITGVGAGGVQTAGTGNPLADLKVIEAQPNSFKYAGLVDFQGVRICQSLAGYGIGDVNTCPLRNLRTW